MSFERRFITGLTDIPRPPPHVCVSVHTYVWFWDWNPGSYAYQETAVPMTSTRLHVCSLSFMSNFTERPCIRVFWLPLLLPCCARPILFFIGFGFLYSRFQLSSGSSYPCSSRQFTSAPVSSGVTLSTAHAFECQVFFIYSCLWICSWESPHIELFTAVVQRFSENVTASFSVQIAKSRIPWSCGKCVCSSYPHPFMGDWRDKWTD